MIGLFSALLIAASVAGPAELDRLQAWADRWPTSDPVPEVSADYRLAGPLYAEIARLAVEKPGVVETEVIGTTLAQQPIFAFHVTEPAVPVERSVLVMAGIHALEWISTEVAVDLLTELIALPPRGTRVTVIPILNVDGRARVEADLFAGQNVYRRGNLVFADLNRDFEVQREARALWRHVIPGYYRTTDAEALSQPESRALDALLDRERYDRAASLHAFGGYLYHPWAGRWQRTASQQAYVRTGRRMEAAQGRHAYRTRQLSRWGFFFRAHGTEVDHMYGRYGTQAWLIELTRSGLAPGALGTYFRWYNPVDPRPHRQRGVAALRVLCRESSSPGPFTGSG